jgi:hypothetical protein
MAIQRTAITCVHGYAVMRGIKRSTHRLTANEACCQCVAPFNHGAFYLVRYFDNACIGLSASITPRSDTYHDTSSI